MKSRHVLRPLYVAVVFVAVVLIAREFAVPEGFGVHENGYMYGWYRLGNIQQWMDFTVKHKGSDYCSGCHRGNYESIMESPHALIMCENCHSPALNHPEELNKLEIDRSRELCLRCHAKLPYANTGRADITGIMNNEHNPRQPCSLCHNPHSPGL